MATIPTPPSGTFGAFKPPETRKSNLFIYLVIGVFVLILAAVYFIFYQGVGFTLTPTFPPAPPLSGLDSRVERLPNFQFSIFDSDFYKSLKIYGAVPVVAGSLGRTNPFVPY